MKHGALILARYSTENQSEDTIEVQVQNCAKYCTDHNLEVLDVFADMAISGMKKTRPAYERMMESLRSGIGDTVVIYDQSRMFRSLTAWFEFREELQKLGASVISVTQSFVGGDINDPSVFMAEGVSAIFNQMWVLQTRQKVLADKTHKAMQGKHLGGKPALGYRKGPDGYLEIEPGEAEIVRLIFDLYDSGCSYMQIITELNQRGMRTKSGKPFGKNSLHDLLRNEKYIGNVISRNYGATPSGGHSRHASDGSKAIRVDGACPAIVSKEVFHRVQERMTTRPNTGGRPVSVTEQPLKGKVFCAGCGSAMSIRYSKGSAGEHTYCYYRCSRKKLHGDDCGTKPIRKDQLESIVAAQVRATISSEQYRDELRNYLLALRGGHDSISGRIKSLNKEISSDSAKIDNGLQLLLDGMDSPALRDKIKRLEAHRASLEASLYDLKAESEAALDIPDTEIDYFIQELKKLSGAEDSAVLAVVARVEVDNETIKVYTIFDGPPGKPRPKAADLLCTLDGIDDVTGESAYNCTDSIWRTMSYVYSAVSLLMNVRRC